MSFTKENIKDHLFFIEASNSSESEEETCYGYMKDQKSTKQFSQLSRDSSPPLLLAFSITSGKTQQDTSSVSSGGSQEQLEEDNDQPIEEWMILEGEEQVEDPSIQLNLGCWGSSEEDFGDEGFTDKKVKSGRDTWAVSDRDKYGAAQSLCSRYFMGGRSSICNICNRTGHVAKSCCFHKQKSPTCFLCGIQGHVQRNCPSRPCSTCGLPSHALNPCKVPPVWKQHCHRCGVTGHMSDACPDAWRQYHLTVKVGVPFRPRTACSHRKKSHCAHCYNCSKRGHYGHECTKKRMISGTFPSLPHVCQYDTLEDILQQSSRTLTSANELVNAGPLPSSQQEEWAKKTGEHCKDWPSVQGRRRTRQEAGTHFGRRKTWPERRRERREVKRLRREAQAQREGLLGRHRCASDDAVCPADPFRNILHSQRQSRPPPEKKRREEKAGKKSRKSREAERWRKRGGTKRGYLYPHSDIDIGSENLLSPKQRVRHRRR
ncbi:zinc finger CCHC domain-containing protein 7-like [Girardinichthys multiradiatus]|uniref:zinc finger CCHC domain-containing protein 7-like n=1 Tax=Girardinichthys multiradiatus TaxID=208333 RepID=UPI001FAD5AE2|nr:zinc finger CCHC domain-containing protein 7-like [Girardinichthys multiradiatus]